MSKEDNLLPGWTLVSLGMSLSRTCGLGPAHIITHTYTFPSRTTQHQELLSSLAQYCIYFTFMYP